MPVKKRESPARNVLCSCRRVRGSPVAGAPVTVLEQGALCKATTDKPVIPVFVTVGAFSEQRSGLAAVCCTAKFLMPCLLCAGQIFSSQRKNVFTYSETWVVGMTSWGCQCSCSAQSKAAFRSAPSRPEGGTVSSRMRVGPADAA